MSLVFCKNEDQSQVAGRATGLKPYRWSNYFTQPIKIPPNSQVAYISSSFNLNQNGSIQENPTYFTIGVPALNMPIPIRPPERYVDDWKDEVNFLARLANEYGTDTDYNHIWEFELPVAGIQNDKFGYILEEDVSNPFNPIPIPADGGVNMVLTDEDKVNTTLYPRPFTAVKFNQGFNCLGRNDVEIEYAGGLVVPAGINTRYSLFNECEWINATASIGSLNARWSSGSSFVQPVVNTAPDTDTPDTLSNFYNTQYTLDAVVSDYNWNGTSAQSLVLPDFDEGEFVATLSTTGIKKFVGDDTPIENGGGHAGVGGSAVVGAGKSGGYAIYGFGNTSQTGANTHFDETFVGSADDVGFCGIAEQFVGVQSIPFIQSYQQSATDDFQTMMNNFLRVVDVNASTNPDLPEGVTARYVLGLKIYEGGDGAGGGTLFAQAQILDPRSRMEHSKYIDVGGALDIKALANGVNTSITPNFTFSPSQKYVLNTYNYSGSRTPAMLLFRFRWTSPYTMAIEYTLNITGDADSYNMATDVPYQPQPPAQAGTPAPVSNPVEVRLTNITDGTTVELQTADGGAISSEINFYDSGGAGGDYAAGELYTIDFDVGSGFQTKLTFNDFAFEHATFAMYDRLGIQVSNDGINYVNISGIPWLNKSAVSTPPYSTSYGGSTQSSSSSFGTDGYILPENIGQAQTYDPTATFPYVFQTAFRYVRFNFTSDGSAQDEGWDITIEPNTPYQTATVDNADPRNEWVVLYDMYQEYTEGQNAFYIPSYFGDMGLVSYHIADNHSHYTKGYYDVRRAYRFQERLNAGAISSKLYTGLNEYYQFFTDGGLRRESLLQKNNDGFTTPKLVGIEPEGFEGDTSAPRKTARWLVNTIKNETDRFLGAVDVLDKPFFIVGEPFKLEMGYILGLIKSNKNDSVVLINDPAVPPDPTNLGFKYDGVNTIQLSDSAFSNHVQLTNLPIQSQNGVVSSQNKLIYVVNSLSVNSIQTDAEYRIYSDTAPVLLWVDLNNFQEINTNRLDILITDDSNREQKLLTGTTDVVLMFRVKPERDAGYLPTNIPVRVGQNLY